MKMLLMLSILAAFLICAGLAPAVVHAQDQIAVQSKTTESVVPELGSIVVLCATEQEKKFKEEWARYVAHNKLKGKELNKTIRQITNEAEIYRARAKKSKLRTAEGRNWKAEQQKIMKEVAERSVITAR